jgi:hypothetical protein
LKIEIFVILTCPHQDRPKEEVVHVIVCERGRPKITVEMMIPTLRRGEGVKTDTERGGCSNGYGE